LEDYSRLPKKDLEYITDAIYDVIYSGSLISSFYITPSIFIETSVLDIPALRKYERLKKQSVLFANKFIFKESVLSFNDGFESVESDHVLLEDLWNFLESERILNYFFLYLRKINNLLYRLIDLIPTFCDMYKAKSLYTWYKHNCTTRDFNGLNSLEIYFLRLMEIRDLDLSFENFKFLGSIWSKDVKKILTSVQKGFSWYHVNNKEGNSSLDMSVKEMEEMMKRSLSGDKDDHDKFMEAWEKQQRDLLIKQAEEAKIEQQKLIKDFDSSLVYTTFD